MSTYAGLTQENGFGSAFFPTLWWLVESVVLLMKRLGQG